MGNTNQHLLLLRLHKEIQEGVGVPETSYTHRLLHLPLVRLHFGLQLVHQVLESEDILAVLLSLQTEHVQQGAHTPMTSIDGLVYTTFAEVLETSTW